MASVFRNGGPSLGWRKHEMLPDLEESPLPDRFRKRPSHNLSAVRMSLRKRMPLKDVEVNVDESPTWESLEAKEKAGDLQVLTRTARSVLGAVSQKIQAGCRGSARSLVSSLAKASVHRVGGATGTHRTPPRTPRRNSKRLAALSTPTSATRIIPPSGKRSSFSPGSRQLQREILPLRRSRRAAALRSPYRSPLPAGWRRPRDCDLELVSTGLRHLKRLSRAFNDIIVQEERDQAIANYYQLMAQNLRAARLQSQNFSRSTFRKRVARLQSSLGTWAEQRFQQY